jgi:hypothetical protein
MKNKFWLSLPFLFQAASSMAQLQEVAFYQVEQQNYVVCSQFQANTSLEFYSTPQGGKRLAKTQANANGELANSFSLSATPAFVINRKTATITSGDNKVYHLTNKEFIATDIEIGHENGISLLQWKAQINDGHDIDFQIYKRIQQGPLQLVETIKGITSTAKLDYSFSEPYTGVESYEIHIVKNGQQIRYIKSTPQANLRVGNVQEYLRAYPTLCNNELNIEIPRSQLPATLRLLDMQGRCVQQLKTFESTQTMNVGQCAKGNYILSIETAATKAQIKITKQ